MVDSEALLAQLSREPDFDAPELRAYDAADLLLLETAAAVFAGSAAPSIADGLAVIGDRHGALTLGAARTLGATSIRVHQDPLLAQRALDTNAARLGPDGRYRHHELGEELLGGARLVLMQLPRSSAELEEIAWNIARYAHPSVTVLAGGRDKHMHRGMNDLLSRHFDEVVAGLGRRKARVLTARSPIPGSASDDPPFPVHAADPELSFELYAFGATFGGARLDHGSRLLLRTLRERSPHFEPQRIVDLGCGNGVLAVSAAIAWPEARILATDQSAAAVAATRLTAAAAGVAQRVQVQRADAGETVPDGWADLVLLNPPFHTGATVHAGVGQRLIRATARMLAPGGELRLVFNSHLGYRPLVEREVGSTGQLARDKTFTVLSTARR